MKLITIVFIGIVIASIGLSPGRVEALGLKVAPLQYKATLTEGERKQGVVDVSNPSSQAVTVNVSVQAFKQTDNNGGLQFYNDQKISNAIRPELETLELGPREAIRLAFTIDGTTLPDGDIFAAIFLSTEPVTPQNGVGQLVRVGTLLSLVNKSPGQRLAKVTSISMPALQLTDTIEGIYTIQNTGSAQSGFYPKVSISSWPNTTSKQVESSLVFGGKERSNDFTYPLGYGIHRVDVSYEDSRQSRWVITIAPWMLVLMVLLILIVCIELFLLKRRRKKSAAKHPETTTSTS